MSDLEQVDPQPFSKKAVLWLVGIVTASFAFALLLMAFSSPPSTAGSWNPHAYSDSAIGHKALVELLGELERPVHVSGHRSGDRARESGLLLLLEPDSGRREDIEFLVGAARKTLLVLPKWMADPGEENPNWVSRVWLASEAWLQEVLGAVGVSGPVKRLADDPAEVSWNPGLLQVRPTIPTAQVVDSQDLQPLVACAAGILLGRVSSGQGDVYVLTDPDLLANHGLARGRNAELVMRVLAHILDPGEVVIVDETLHGFGKEPGIWQELFAYPLVLSVAQAVLTTLVLLWAAMARFGAPVAAPLPYEPGKSFLIDNTAELVRYGGHSAHSLERYFHDTLRDVGSHLHAPEGLSQSALVEWLAGLPRGEAMQRELRRLVERLREVKRVTGSGKGHVHRVVATARRIHAWRQEILNGPESDQGRD